MWLDSRLYGSLAKSYRRLGGRNEWQAGSVQWRKREAEHATVTAMARLTHAGIEAELESIAALITAQTVGLNKRSVGRLYLEAHGKRLSSRTLQRRLEELTVRGRVAPAGDGPSTVYQRIGPSQPSDVDGDVPLTVAGAKARSLVRRPINERQPVGYDPDWLRKYQPGKTWYLPRSTRLRLERQGRIPGDDRPAGTFARDILGRLLIDLSWCRRRHSKGWRPPGGSVLTATGSGRRRPRRGPRCGGRPCPRDATRASRGICGTIRPPAD